MLSRLATLFFVKASSTSLGMGLDSMSVRLLLQAPRLCCLTLLQSVHMKVTDNASNIKKAFKFFDGGFCFLHTLELVVREFMGNESVQPWMIKIKGLCRHLKMSLSGWTCFAEL
jgi:hypothetical protein